MTRWSIVAGMSERTYETQSAMCTGREYALIRQCQLRVSRLRNMHAQRHLMLGFQRRLLLNQASRLHLEAVVSRSRRDALSTYACAELDVHLKSFFVPADDFERLRAALFESINTGTYEPWFMQYGLAGYEVRDIRSQVHADCDEVLTVSENVLAAVLG